MQRMILMPSNYMMVSVSNLLLNCREIALL